MSTVDKKFADQMVACNGQWPSDGRDGPPDAPVVRIIEYKNTWGGLSYGMEYEGELGKYAASDYVRNPRVYWEHKS